MSLVTYGIIGALLFSSNLSGTFERTSSSFSSCQGTWTFDGATVSVEGQAIDLNANDGEPASCVFSMRFGDQKMEYYVSPTSLEGPFSHSFSQGSDPQELKVQPCRREWTGMDECDGYFAPPIWTR